MIARIGKAQTGILQYYFNEMIPSGIESRRPEASPRDGVHSRRRLDVRQQQHLHVRP